MIPSFECDYDFDVASEQLKTLTADLVKDLPPAYLFVRLPADCALPSPDHASDGAVYIVREGCLKLYEGDRPIMTFEEGEAVPLPSGSLRLGGPDFSVAVDVVSSQQLGGQASIMRLERFYANLWSNVTARVVQKNSDLLPSTRIYKPGGIIIEQGAVATDVLTLMEGDADVFVDGVKVGEVKTNEFFGVLAAVTDGRRTARVVARTPCAVLAVPKEHFQELIRARPALVEKLIVELGRTITELNTKLVTLAKGKSPKDWA
jgi:hypothetical protein